MSSKRSSWEKWVAVLTTLDDKRKYDNLVVQYKTALAFLRELLNHTFLRAIYHTSTRQAQTKYKEIQHLHANIILITLKEHNIDHLLKEHIDHLFKSKTASAPSLGIRAKILLAGSSNHGEMTCVPLACASYLLLTDVIPKILPPI